MVRDMARLRFFHMGVFLRTPCLLCRIGAIPVSVILALFFISFWPLVVRVTGIISSMLFGIREMVIAATTAASPSSSSSASSPSSTAAATTATASISSRRPVRVLSLSIAVHLTGSIWLAL